MTAGYNRSTFYNHFTDIYDLQDKAVDSVFRPTQEEVFAIGDFRLFFQGNTAETIISSCFLIEDKYIELLFHRHAEYLIGEKSLIKYTGINSHFSDRQLLIWLINAATAGEKI